ncbi:MAG: dephospho-CoA kinase [Alphaproteobacteria bacterium]|nr:dephospho-CoA kinase [Alphaproteobacteria bacterium]
MILIGLTGSIGMGKSETARMFRQEGVPVYDADAAVHALMRPGGAAVPKVEAAFPGVVRDGAIDRPELGRRVFGKPDELRRLERIIHPLVGLAQRRFLQQAQRRGEPMVVLDIPLLFETGGERYVDVKVVVSAPAALQRQRVLARPGMTDERLVQVLAQQTPDAVKRRRADFVVPSGLGKAVARRTVRRIIRLVKGRRGRVWPHLILKRRTRK